MSASISRYLKDFSAPKVEISLMPPKYFPDLDDDMPGHGVIDVKPSVPQVDIDAERREAMEQGRRQVREELQALHAKELAELRAQHASEMETLRIRCDNEISAMIQDRVSDMAARLSVMIGDQTARVLAPVMDTVLLQKAVADLAGMVSQSILAGEVSRITVKGPTALFEALKSKLDSETLVFRHIETTDIDLSVEFGDSILVTRMAAWADTVRKVLA